MPILSRDCGRLTADDPWMGCDQSHGHDADRTDDNGISRRDAGFCHRRRGARPSGNSYNRRPRRQHQVEPRVMQVLIVLSEAGGGVVTRDTLLARCWGGFYAGDDSLNRAIGGVRRVASSIAAESFEIETIPRTGYRLVTHRRRADLAGGDALDATDTDQSPPETGHAGVSRRCDSWRRRRTAAVAGLAFWQTRPVPSDAVDQLMADSRTVMRAGTAAKAREAIALLERAVDLAPGNAEAWGLLALTKARADEHAIDKTMLPAGEVAVAANHALEIDPNNADASASLAIAIPYYGDWFAAEDRFDNVLRAHPATSTRRTRAPSSWARWAECGKVGSTG